MPGELMFVKSTSLTTVKLFVCVIVVVAVSSVGPGTSVVTTLAVLTKSAPKLTSACVTS